ncbi:MAG: SpoIIE family protein phosphatase [candidate division Zixibacteria bacterium]|nr:SpoIIE family protein phosphatase [candidate division Zixibacteria bacterium]
MAPDHPRQYVYTFKSSEEYLPEIRRQVRKVCEEVEFDRKLVMAIQLVIEEACSNVIRHAYMLGEGMIRLVFTLEKDQIIFTIIDSGRSFDFDKDEAPDLAHFVETGRKGGLGLYLIKKVMDEVDYGPVGDENHFRLVKYFDDSRRQRKKVEPAKSGISFKTKFSITAAVAIILIMASIFLYQFYKVTTSIRQDMYTETNKLIVGLAERLSDKMALGNELEMATLVQNAHATIDNIESISVIDTTGLIWADTRDESLLLTEYEFPGGLGPSAIGRYQYLEGLSGKMIHMLSAPIKHQDELQGRVIAIVPESFVAAAIRSEQRSLIIISLISLTLAGIIIYLIAFYHGRPVSKLSKSVSRLGQDGQLDERIKVNGQDELAEIARAFNEMRERFQANHREALEEQRLKTEMQTAETIQQALLPKGFPKVPGVEIAASYKPTKHVSGDYFDFIKVDDTHLGIVVADVSSSGVPGALVMNMVRTAIRMEARHELSPARVVKNVNEFIREDIRKGMFITILYMIFDIEHRTVKFVSAGHNPLILFRSSADDCFLFNPRGIPLGISLPEDLEHVHELEEQELTLQVDDMIIMYTDGVTECRNSRGELFGENRLVTFLRRNGSRNPKELTTNLMNDLDEFVDKDAHDDDITILTIQEKVSSAAVTFKRVEDLLKGVEHGEFDAETACQMGDISPRRFSEMNEAWKNAGKKGLLELLRKNKTISQEYINYRQSKQIRRIVNENPMLNAREITNKLSVEHDGNGAGISAVRKELQRLHLGDKTSRIKYSMRRGPETVRDPAGILRRTSGGIKAPAPSNAESQYDADRIIEQSQILDREYNIDSMNVEIVDRSHFLDMLYALKRSHSDAELVSIVDKLIEYMDVKSKKNKQEDG